MLASRNRGKLAELRALAGSALELIALDDPQLSALGPAPQVEESAESYLENALEKARAIAGWSGRLALADDSGLEVDLLGGAPGVRSARFGGAAYSDGERCLLLLQAMRDARAEAGPPGGTGLPGDAGLAGSRAARFRCVVVLAAPPGRSSWVPGDSAQSGGLRRGRGWIAAEGVLEGTIAEGCRGDAGFGYDPVFVAAETPGRTLAEVGVEAKNAWSHRARAMAALVAALGGAPR